MWLPVSEKQYNDAYELINAMKVINLISFKEEGQLQRPISVPTCHISTF